MKVALITDTHFGVRQDSLRFQNNIETFLDRVFFPELKERDITHIIHLGDVFDSRKRIDVRTMEFAREKFFERLVEGRYTIDIILGNHDIYTKNSLAQSALYELVNDNVYENVSIINTATHSGINKDILYVPWITNENREETLDTIRKSKAKIAMGHLELNGYNFSKVQVAHHGDDPATFKRFEHVFSGHFHHRHTKDNITYLGSPTEHTWIDAHDPRGFHIFDTETHEIEFIQNEYSIFEYIDYPEIPTHFNRFFRVKVNEEVKQSELDKYIAALEDGGAYDIKIVNTASKSIIKEDTSNQSFEAEDSLSFIMKYAEEDLVPLVEELYNQAILEVN